MTAADLKTLRNMLRPAFLWDAQRRRVVWANAAAVEFFGAQGLADLVERPFDAREAGVRALQRAHEELCVTGRESLQLSLHFPSTGNDAPLSVTLRPQHLADGRCGLLAVASESSASVARPQLLREILLEMPQPLLAVTQAGEPLLMNDAAAELLGSPGETQAGAALVGLFPSVAAAGAFLLRAREAGTATTTRHVKTPLGTRTLRLTARASSDADIIVITLDDLTDRLQAERDMPSVFCTDGILPGQDALELPPASEEAAQQPAEMAEEAETPTDVEREVAGLQPRELATLRRIMEALEAAPDVPDVEALEAEAAKANASEASPATQLREEVPQESPHLAESSRSAQPHQEPPQQHEAEEEPRPRATAPRQEEGVTAQTSQVFMEAEATEKEGQGTARRPRISIRVTRPDASGAATFEQAKQPASAQGAASDEQTLPTQGEVASQRQQDAGDMHAEPPLAVATAGADVQQGTKHEKLHGEERQMDAILVPEREAASGLADERASADEQAAVPGEEQDQQPSATPQREETKAETAQEAPARQSAVQSAATSFAEDPQPQDTTTAGQGSEHQAVGQTAADQPEGAPVHADDKAEDRAGEEQAGEKTAESRAEDEGEAETPLAERPQPPQLVRDVLDHRPEPIILHRADAFYFANAAARELFGFAEEDAHWDALARTLTATHDGGEVELETATGQCLRFRLKRDVFPWRAGVVVQSTLRLMQEQPEQPAAARHAEAPASSGHATEQAEAGSQASGGSVTISRRAPAPVIRIHADHGRQHKHDDGGNASASATTQMPEGEGQAARIPPASSAPDSTAAGTATALAHQPDAELRTMLETAVDGIITLNARGEILSFSSGAERLFGRRAEDVVGRLFRDLLTEESRTMVDTCLARLLQASDTASRQECGQGRGREVQGLTGSGETISLYLTVGLLHHALPRDMDNRASFCVVVHDFSSFKQRESELRRAKEEAEELSARKSEFLARISHELRTPLNAILGFSDVLRQELFGALGNEKYRDYARDIYESGEHLLALVNDLLDLTRIEAGRYELDMKEVDLAAVVEDAANLLRDQIGAAGVTLRRIMPEGLPRVVADARSLKQILLNLLSNAIKFSNAGDRIVVALRQRPDGGLELVVKDTGPGMNEQELQTALEPFRRVPRTGADKPGTGLGLPLAKALTEANRARFEIDSEPGKGTEVRIVFPPHRVLA